ncbi:bifunctional DNA primase/polymerase [Rhodopirellula sp. P2]|uniref:bifunctional DNA primase/polymerase n=1 Tax=Rhodopirellula sp. P2 TaxID=2127060 RepID=UPI00236883F1|nr:bifunctional DNA primase/polymerase [Rhodopirellula sp. P2]WDQ19013.1 bifunctional DNA primase/polymerase [Rhodopirellula sp. P2]
MRSERQPRKCDDSATRRPQYTIARDYIAAGVSVIPLRMDGSKAPAVQSWNEYRTRFATDDELRSFFANAAGIGLVSGIQSGGMEVLDFDEQPDETFDQWLNLLPANLLCRLCVVETGGLGYHVLYRCVEVSGNTKIAMTAAGGVLVESRGEGGYIVGVGSAAGVHQSGSPYVQVRGIPLPELPTMTPEERKILWCAAASLDERPDPMAEYVRQRRSELRPSIESDTSTPWGDFDRGADWLDILQPHGWTTTNGVSWTRPGKQFGTSAKIVVAKDGTEVLTVFSATAGPLAAEGVGHRTWGKFSAFASLNHGGDRCVAARAVIAMGYGRAGQ